MQLPTSISEIQEGLKKGDFSCVDMVDSYLERIEKYDRYLNSYITITSEKAYEKARKFDNKINQLKEDAFLESPLLGVVVSIKDLFLTKGVRTTAGSNLLSDYVPAYSAEIINKIEDNGAIVIGKTNCDAWAHGASGENSDYGSTKNPWNTEYVSGGSSSGSAASVAAQFCLASFGTDTGGSIRQPASFCGVVGFKPTYGAVSRYGVIAMASSLDSVGHFTVFVNDAEKIFNVIKGEDGFDSTVKNISENKVRKVLGRKLRIGIPKEYFLEGLDRDVEKEVLSACDVFKKSGIEVVDVSLPNTHYAISVYYIIQPAEVASNLGRFDGIRFGNDRSKFSDEAKRRIMLGTYVLSAGYFDEYYLKAMKVRRKIINDFDNVFDKDGKSVDAIVAPVSPNPGFKLGSKKDSPLQMYLADILTVSANLAGIPGISIPTGNFNKNNLPFAFQLMGPRFSENILFELGKIYQKEIDYKFKLPDIK